MSETVTSKGSVALHLVQVSDDELDDLIEALDERMKWTDQIDQERGYTGSVDWRESCHAAYMAALDERLYRQSAARLRVAT